MKTLDPARSGIFTGETTFYETIKDRILVNQKAGCKFQWGSFFFEKMSPTSKKAWFSDQEAGLFCEVCGPCGGCSSG